MQIDAVIETIRHVFTQSVIGMIFLIAAGIACVLAAVLLWQVSRYSPAKGSMRTFTIVYVLGIVAMLVVTYMTGFSILG